jgi:glycosyltransferase involved in cell wall biosynthesis
MPLLSSGGAERATASVASSLDPERFESVIVLQSDGPRTYEPASHVRVVEVGAPRTHSALLPLTRALRRERPDLIYAVLPHLNLLSAAAVRTMRTPRPVLVTGIQNNLTAELPQWSNGALLTRLTPWVYRQSDGVVAVSQGTADEASRAFGADPSIVHVIPNSVDAAPIRAKSESREPHRWLDDDGLRVVVAMGRLTAQKNYPVLLDAFARVAAADTAARLLILGEGELRGELEQRVAALGLGDVVEFAGAQANPFGFLVRADVFVSSSDFEGFPLAHLEALALGVPVVATDCDYGPGEILEGGRVGVLASVGSAEGVADGILAVLGDPERRAALHSSGPVRAADFELGRVVPQFDALFTRLLAQRGTR